MASKTSVTNDTEEDDAIFVRVFINKKYELAEGIDSSLDVWKLAELDKSQIDMESLREDIPQAFRKAKWIEPLFKNKKHYTWKIYSYDTSKADIEIDDDDLQAHIDSFMPSDSDDSNQDAVTSDTKYLKLRVVFFNNQPPPAIIKKKTPPLAVVKNNDGGGGGGGGNNDLKCLVKKLVWIQLIDNLNVDETQSNNVLESHKSEWQSITHILKNDTPETIQIPNSSYRNNLYQFFKAPSKNEFALSLSEIFENDNNVYFITSNTPSTINELTEAQSADDMYNSYTTKNGKQMYPQYNWCIFLKGYDARGHKYNPYNARCNTWKSFYIDEEFWQKYEIILESKKQITLQHNDTKNKNKYWYLRINKYRYNKKIGGNIHCIVEAKHVVNKAVIVRTDDTEKSLKLLNECDLIKLFCSNGMALIIINFCGGDFVWNWWYKFITELEYDSTTEQHIENKNEWNKIQYLLKKWDVNDIANFNVPQYCRNWYPLNPEKTIDENKFALSLHPILLKQRSIGRSRDILCYIKSNDKHILDELQRAQILSDEYKYNAAKHYDTNWCIFFHQYQYVQNLRYSYDAWMTSDHLNYTTVFCCRNQITLFNKQLKDKKYWFLKIGEYERNRRMGKNIYCIVESNVINCVDDVITM